MEMYSVEWYNEELRDLITRFNVLADTDEAKMDVINYLPPFIMGKHNVRFADVCDNGLDDFFDQGDEVLIAIFNEVKK